MDSVKSAHKLSRGSTLRRGGFVRPEGVHLRFSGGGRVRLEWWVGGGGLMCLKGVSLERRGSIRTGLGYDCRAGKF